MAMLQLECSRDEQAVERLLDAIEEHLGDAGATMAEAMQLRLVAEEIVTNIARCAWPEGEEGRFSVELEAVPDPAGLQVRLTTIDDGAPFDPTVQKAPDIEAGIDDRAIGGLGMFLVKEMTDAQRYARADGENRFCVEKLLHRAA